MSANITYRSPSCDDIFTDYSGEVLFLDTTALIAASTYPEFATFLTSFVTHNCQLFILPSVKFEFTRMAKSDARLREYNKLITQLGITVYPRLESKLTDPEIDRYLMIYNDCVNKSRSLRKAPSFTDSLLCVIMYLYRDSPTKVKLMTANYTDIPIQFFDRKDLITIDAITEIHTEGIYSFNKKHYARELSKFLKANNINDIRS